MAAPDRPADAPHAPARGAAHRLLGRFHVTGVFWYRLHHFGATHVPAWMHGFFITLFTLAFTPFLGRIRGAVNANLEPVLGPAGAWARWRRGYRTFHAFAHCLSDRYRGLTGPGAPKFSVEGDAYFAQALTKDRGVVLVTAHIGPWELAAPAGALHEPRPVHVLREEEIDPRAQAFVRELAAKSTDNLVTHFFSKDDPRLAIELSEALRRGELVALQGDRPRVGGRVVQAQIFGKPFPLPIGPAALARAAGVPLVPVFTFREGAHTGRTVVRRPIVIARTDDRDADISAAVRELAGHIEWAIRERPHQWFCFRRLWD